MTQLKALVATELRRPARAEVCALAQALQRQLGGDAVLFYGSGLRGDDLDGVLDFYVLHDRALQPLVWPRISYHEIAIDGRMIRAKVASMPLATFEEAAGGTMIDTTIWTRFAQPSRMLLAVTPEVAERTVNAVALCIRTAARFAAVLGPSTGSLRDYWLALFQQTFHVEFRVEKAGRAETILNADPSYYEWMLLLAWRELGFISPEAVEPLGPIVAEPDRSLWLSRWWRRRLVGKALNLLRLFVAAWTFDGAARYALWKIERHRGLQIELTPWRERHPVLAAPGVLFTLWRTAKR